MQYIWWSSKKIILYIYMIRRNIRRQDSTMNMDFILLFEIYIISGRKSLWLLRMTYNKIGFFWLKKSKVIEKNDDKCKYRIGLKPIESA
jgi:hypothetical protein